MRKIAVSSLALVTSAAVVLLAACTSTNDGPVSPPSLRAPLMDVGVPTAGLAQVCISSTSPVTGYSFTPGSITNGVSGDAASTVNLTVPSSYCGNVLVRNPLGTSSQYATVTVTAAIVPSVSGSWTWTCAGGGGGISACPVTSGTGITAIVGESSDHGGVLTFTFVPDASHGSGCTYTQGYWKNKGKATTNLFPFAGGNALTNLQTPPKGGNVYYILSHQYIAAALNVANGASMDNGDPLLTTDDVLAAFQAATLYFNVASAGTPLPSPYTKGQVTGWANTLDQYNNGLLGPGHCDDIILEF